jgi:outer membrane protein assembly factor BamB
MSMVMWIVAAPLVVQSDDWPTWGRDASRNMVSSARDLPDSFDPGKPKSKGEAIDPATTRHVRWVAKLGSQAYGNPVVAGGRVYVGTNNEAPRDPKYKGDRATLLCFDEKTGEFLWQLSIPKLGTGKVSDWEYVGICSPATVEGDRLYLTTNRCEVVCLDVKGQADGNDGPFYEEAKYLADKGQPPVELGPRDADIIWRFDMREELGVFPHNITAGAVLILGDRVAATTANGVDWTHTTIPNPKAPALCLLDKQTGKYLGEEASGISARTLHGNWSSPAYGKAGDREMILFGGGDGIAYAFGTEPGPERDGLRALVELWRFDCNPPHYRVKDGKPIKYATPNGPSEVMATPVFYKNRVYCAIGQDPEHGEGIGNLVCIDATRSGDVTGSAKVWSYDKIARSMSTVSIADGLLYVGDFNGYVHCVDAETGKPYWVFDSESRIWGSTLVADGKVYFGTDDKELIVLAAGKTLREVARIKMDSAVYSSPVAANGTLYVASQSQLYAIGK